MRAALIDQVGDVMRAVAAEVILPRFRALAGAEVSEKAPGELVTVADREAEQLLTESLLELLPGSRVVGEEEASRDPSLLASLDAGDVWLVDPLDGTRNFVSGSSCFAVMVALLAEGEPVAAWMLDPASNLLSRAERGAGAYLEGERLQTVGGRARSDELRGAVLTKYMPDGLRDEVERRFPRLREVLPGTHCAGAEYPAIVGGRQDFALFWRTLPWDHAPGTLFLTEAGGLAARYDGTPYRVSDDRYGLLVARNPAVWDEVQRALLTD